MLWPVKQYTILASTILKFNGTEKIFAKYLWILNPCKKVVEL